MSDTSNINPGDSGNLRIGARVVVELLRLQADNPGSSKIALTPVRSKNAMAVLRDRLLQVQHAAERDNVRLQMKAGIIERCQDLQIPLPVAEPDWGVIVLLDHLFDRWLDNKQLDQQAQLWLASLRMPVIRYALLDYSFFFAPQNLVRRFLNQLNLTILSSTQKSRQILRESLQGFIQRILTEFQNDISAFNSVCIEAQTWFAGHADKMEQIEAQIRVRESGLRKEQVAEPRVVNQLNRVAAGKQVPQLLLEFLHGEWRRSLQMISMREGEEGGTWKRQIRITESLVEFAQGCGDDKGRDKYRSFYPVMMKNIKTLLVSVSDDAAAMEAALDPLELILTAMLSGANPGFVEVPELALTQSHITAVEIKQVSQRALANIQRLQIGDWVRIKTADGSYELCRLTIKAEADELWVLVSQSGKTVTKKNAFQLAQGLEGGVLEVIGQGQWWDEQLDDELARLHQMWQAALAAQPPQPRAKPVKPESPKAKPVPDSPPQPQEPVAAETETESMALSLLPNEAVDEDVARQAAVNSRTDEILQHSQLSLVGSAAPGNLAQVPAPAVSETDDDAEDFLAPRPLTEEELQAAVQAIDQIQVGGWIVQQTSGGEERCKLAVKIRGRDKLIFVNRLGVKALEIERDQLASLLARGLVSIVDTGEKFDNTLERVVRSIQEERKPT